MAKHAAFNSTNPLGYHGITDDSDVCDGPSSAVAQCDVNGNYVDDGGDPANCPPDDDASGGTTGSGIQYYPGDYTNGETVNFTTGIGDGGQSVCGSAAQVEEVCIDKWDDVTQEWREAGCGYATTC